MPCVLEPDDCRRISSPSDGWPEALLAYQDHLLGLLRTSSACAETPALATVGVRQELAAVQKVIRAWHDSEADISVYVERRRRLTLTRLAEEIAQQCPDSVIPQALAAGSPGLLPR